MPYLLLPTEAQFFRNVRRALTQLYQRARAGQLHPPVVVIFGDDEFLVQRVAQRLIELLLPATERATALTVVDGKDATVEQFVDALLVPTFGFEQLKRRVVWVKAPAFAKEREGARRRSAGAWWEWLKQVPAGTFVLLTFNEPLPPPLLSVLEPVALLVPVAKLRSQDLPEFVQMLAEQAGVHLTGDAAQELIERVGNDARQLANELEKLALFVGVDGRVTAELVRELVPSLAMDVFALVNAVTDGDAKTALRMLDGLLQRRESPMGILGMLTRQFRFLLQARLLLDAKVIAPALLYARTDAFRQQLERIPDDVVQRLPSDPRYNLLRQSPTVVRTFLLRARPFSAPQLRRALQWLLDADIGLKTGVDQGQQLALLVLRLCRLAQTGAQQGSS